ncbi:MAG: hypothetical protein GXO69_00140 [Acidobacteria bacterium]|nr:hypothetical protein [Acidobacteriota bacterium]
MEKGTIIIVNLQNPREKVIGIIHEIRSSGIVVRGIDVNSFQDWASEVCRNGDGRAICPTTMFLPMHRVVRADKDEDMGTIPSFSTQFKKRTGLSMKDLLK